MGIRIERWSGAGEPDARELRARLEAEGYSVFEWTDRPGEIYPEHEHQRAQSHWVLSGQMELTVGGVAYVLGAGDRDFLEAGTRHAARVVGDTAVVYLVGQLR
jgi:quercetin dioxygenase-like cupin family protein